MPATLASEPPPALGTPIPAQDDAYTWLQAVEQGLSTSNTTQLALSQQLSSMQAQLEEHISSMRSASLGVTHSPSVLSNAPLLPTPDHSPLESSQQWPSPHCPLLQQQLFPNPHLQSRLPLLPLSMET